MWSFLNNWKRFQSHGYITGRERIASMTHIGRIWFQRLPKKRSGRNYLCGLRKNAMFPRREEKNILKIGMTTRNVQKRVNEINSATGVIYPLAARKVFKVKNSRLVEKEIHKLLSEYRLRADREFFMVDYSVACNIIDKYLTENHLYYYE